MKKLKTWLADQYTGSLIIWGILIIGFLSFIGYLANNIIHANSKIFQLNFIALLLGLVFEYKRIVRKWSTVLWTFIGAFIFSLFSFLKGKNEAVYDLEDHLVMWPYFFLGLFIFSATAVYFSVGTKKITEGTTLLITISINYWLLANNYWYAGFIWLKCLMVLNFVISALVIFNVLSYKILGNGVRILLSIWTSSVALILATDNIVKLYEVRDIEHLPTTTSAITVFMEFFFLGVSSIYIAQNIGFLGAYLPGRNYLQNIRGISEQHLKRYSDEQVYIVDAIIALIISIGCFALNDHFHFLPINFMIWAIISIVPLFINIIHRILS